MIDVKTLGIKDRMSTIKQWLIDNLKKRRSKTDCTPPEVVKMAQEIEEIRSIDPENKIWGDLAWFLILYLGLRDVDAWDIIGAMARRVKKLLAAKEEDAK